MTHADNVSNPNRLVKHDISGGDSVLGKTRSARPSCFKRLCFGSRAASSVSRRSVDSCHEPGASTYTTSTAENRGTSPVLQLPSQPSMSLGMPGGVCLSRALAYSCTKRGRLINEDSWILESRELFDGVRITLMGVFDGHGNEQLSHWLSGNFSDVFFKLFAIFQQSFGLPRCIGYSRQMFPSEDSFRSRVSRLYALSCPDFITLALSVGLAICEEWAMSIANVDTAHGGSCATVIAVARGGFYVAKVGDCSASLLAPKTRNLTFPVLLKTSDHRPVCRPDEVHRVTQLGGKVYKGNAVGMAFSSLNVTRSLGDTLWRANDDWKRDMTKDPTTTEMAVDEELSNFSRQKGCVGISSDPEWYVASAVRVVSELEESTPTTSPLFKWEVSTNSPDKTPSIQLPPFDKGPFFLILGSDGFWETNANSLFVHRMAKDFPESPTVDELMQTAVSAIGTGPHDDSTVIIAQIDVHKVDQLGYGNIQQSPIKHRRNSEQGQLDYLFN